MTKLRYLGVRDLKFTDPRFGREYDFTGEDKTCEVEDGHAKIILAESPKGFEVVDKTLEVIVDEDEVKTAEEAEAEKAAEKDAEEDAEKDTPAAPEKPELVIKT